MKEYPQCSNCAYRRSRFHCESCRFRPEKDKRPTNWAKSKTVFVRAGASGGYYWIAPDHAGEN